MQILIVQEHGLYCPACRTTFSKEFVEAYPDMSAKLHSKQHKEYSLDTPEFYNQDILKWSFPQETYELYTGLYTGLSTDRSYC